MIIPDFLFYGVFYYSVLENININFSTICIFIYKIYHNLIIVIFKQAINIFKCTLIAKYIIKIYIKIQVFFVYMHNNNNNNHSTEDLIT